MPVPGQSCGVLSYNNQALSGSVLVLLFNTCPKPGELPVPRSLGTLYSGNSIFLIKAEWKCSHLPCSPRTWSPLGPQASMLQTLHFYKRCSFSALPLSGRRNTKTPISWCSAGPFPTHPLSLPFHSVIVWPTHCPSRPHLYDLNSLIYMTCCYLKFYLSGGEKIPAFWPKALDRSTL